MAKINKKQNINLIQWLILIPFYAYRGLISPLLRPHCRFYPSCSIYAITALRNHGIILGIFFTVKRLLKCHPWHCGGVDLIPITKQQRNSDKKI